MKSIILLSYVLLLNSMYTMAQFKNDEGKTNFFVAHFGAGYSIEVNKPSFSWGAGARYLKNVYSDFYMLLTDDGYKPKIFVLRTGYNVGSFQPFISGSYQTIGAVKEQYLKGTPDEFINGFRYGGGITYYSPIIPLALTLQRQGKESNITLSYIITP